MLSCIYITYLGVFLSGYFDKPIGGISIKLLTVSTTIVIRMLIL